MASQASSSRAGSRAGEPTRPGDSNQGDAHHPEASPDGARSGEAQGSRAAQGRLASFAEFWPYYVGEHSDPWTRRLHFVGTTAAGLCLASAIASRRPARILAALVAGYGPAWASHFFVEKNRPATFTYPLWSLLADFKMWSMIARGTMDAEVARVMADREASAASVRGSGAAAAPAQGAANVDASAGNQAHADTAPGATVGARKPSGVLN